MPDGQIDPSRLEGEELQRWFRRTPEEIERGRQAAYAKRHREFFYGPGSNERTAETEGVRANSTWTAISPADGRRYGALYAPPPDDLAELRRQQAEERRRRGALAKENSWMAVPALAPAAAIFGLEAGAAIAARLAPEAIQGGPLLLSKRMPYLRVGDNWSTRAGRLAHKDLELRGEAKAGQGWASEKSIKTENGLLRPDLMAPARNPGDARRRYLMELNPNTPSGRRAGARAAERYTRETGNKTRVIYYNPKDFM